MLKPILSSCVTVLMVVSLTACSNSSSSDGGAKGAFPSFSAQNISPEGCLNVALVQQRLSSGSYPAIAVTTDFKADSSLGTRKDLFHTYSAFDVRDINTNEIALLVNPAQSGCSEVSANTVSGEQQRYKVTSSSPNSITIDLQNPSENQTSAYRLKALKKKMQPTKQTIEILSPTHMRVSTTYRGFDAHCRGSKPITSTIQKDYMWGKTSEALPGQVEMKESFYQKALSAMKDSNGPVTPLPPLEPEPQPETEPQPQPAPAPQPVVAQPTAPAATPEIPATDGEYHMPGTPENPWLPSPVRFAELNQVIPDAATRTVSIQELRSLVTKPAKDEISRCFN